MRTVVQGFVVMWVVDDQPGQCWISLNVDLSHCPLQDEEVGHGVVTALKLPPVPTLHYPL